MKKKRLSGAEKLIVWFMIPNMLLLLAIALTAVYVSYDAAWLLSFFGTPGIMIVDFIYILFFDARKRWPTLTARQRAVKVFTFER